MTNNGTLAFNRSDAVSFSGAIAGAGAVNQIGTGTTMLTGANTYSGAHELTPDTAIGRRQHHRFARPATSSTTATLPSTAQRRHLRCVISGAGAVNQTGTGTTILTGSNTYSGGATISAGTLQFGRRHHLRLARTGNVADNGALAVQPADAVTFSGAITGTGASTRPVTGTTTPHRHQHLQWRHHHHRGTLQLGSWRHRRQRYGNGDARRSTARGAFNCADGGTFAGAIAGAGALNQIDAGTMMLTGANIYSGDHDHPGRTLQLGGGGTTARSPAT